MRLDEWERMASRAGRCSGQPVIMVSIAGAVDVEALAHEVRMRLRHADATV